LTAPAPPGQPWFSGIGPFLTVGIQLAVTVVVLFFLGRWLDDRLGTSPWLMLAGLLLGIVGGMIKFFRSAIDLGRQEDAQSRKGGGA
jgi:F0F1-type ATP synthase assembly protein I